jgi:hypothetical protein
MFATPSSLAWMAVPTRLTPSGSVIAAENAAEKAGRSLKLAAIADLHEHFLRLSVAGRAYVSLYLGALRSAPIRSEARR